LGLNQAAANDTGHATPPEERQAKSLLRVPARDKFPAPDEAAGKIARGVELFYLEFAGQFVENKDVRIGLELALPKSVGETNRGSL
jgi:hypothetical protein